jgi:pyruvate-formate lyase-activating enzyme
VRWLFAARPDSFVRERARLEQTIAAADETGHMVEMYLSGFESFCDAELRRYNKGATVADLAAAIERMRELSAAHPKAFAHAKARGHSLILWSPWTTPEDIGESVRNLRALGAREIFHEIGKNRLRLYRDLPIYYAAERDGAFVDAWEDGDEGAGRRKGYNVERPWRFLDRRTRLAYELGRALRDRLGAENELSQLAAVVDHATSPPAADLDDVVGACERAVAGAGALDEALLALARPREGGPPRGASERGSVVAFAGRCNNGCRACGNKERYLDDAAPALLERVDEARARSGPVMLAGREPTMHPAFLEAVKRARGDDRRPVGVVTNGRRFAHAPFAKAAIASGLSAASIKVFAPRAAVADAITRVEGGFEQALAGIAALRALGQHDVEVRAPLHRDNLDELATYADLARRTGARQLRVECSLDAVGLDRLQDAAAAIGALAARCEALGVPLEASTLGSSTRLFDRYPGSTRGRR